MDVDQLIKMRLLPAIMQAGFKPIGSSDKWPDTAPNAAWSFSNGKVRLDLFYADQTGELSLGLEHGSATSPAVPVFLVLEREQDLDANWAAHGLILHDVDRAEAALTRPAKAIDRNSQVLANLSRAEVSDLYEHWVRRAQIEARSEEVAEKVAEAEAYWERGDYSQCAQILGSLQADLTPAQQKRFELAQRKAI